MTRKYNFSAGPCTLPLSVLEAARDEFVDYQNAGMSLIEMSHRGKHFVAVAEAAEACARDVFRVPDEFAVLFLQGGALLQFAMVPMNLLNAGQRAAYVNSGTWAKGAIKDAQPYGDIYTAWDGAPDYTRMPEDAEIELQKNTRYLHITSNETIGGVRFADWPKVEVPLVADMSSDYMSRPVPWDKFDLIYGGAQKNLGPAGLTVIFIRRSILENCNPNLARYLKYPEQVDKDSMLNTPPVFAIYMLGKVLAWMQQAGGVRAMETAAAHKSALLYDTIDTSANYYRCPVEPRCRSQMNVVFRLPSEDAEARFLNEAADADLVNLKGHRSVGGVRASIYNAMPEAGVQALADFMREFQRRNG